MCGILAIAGGGHEFHHKMLRTLKNRGPDEIGFWTGNGVHLAHTRLSIIGLDERGSEPMHNERYVLVYNGEIYNFIEIAQRLRSKGYQTDAVNDAEVLLQAWSAWGSDILKDCSGFWAFCIYDKVEHSLYLVRDQLGIKPLYYAVSDEGIYVSSLMSTILDVMNGPRELNHEALSEYAQYQFTFGDKTFMRKIRKVLPGHIVKIDLKTRDVTSRCYEDILAPAAEQDPFSAAWVEETRELVKQCVVESTISDTSFTTFCSGGIDSSLITRIAQPEIAYHCNYSDPDCNETFFAQRAVEGLSTRLFVVNASEDFDLVERLRGIVKDFDEPTIGSVILPLDDLLAQVKRRYKVILTGTGGDELFAGYVRYMLTLGECNQDNYRALFNKVRALESSAERFELCHRKGDTSVYRFFDNNVRSTFVQEFDRLAVGCDPLRAMLRFDARNFLGGLLNIDDKMCGRHSLEGRPSLLHQKLVRRLQRVTLRSEDFMKNGELKSVLRTVATGILPNSIVQRRDKMGFTTPIGTFINRSAHLIREHMFSSRFKDFYDLKKINFTAETKYSREVFGLLMLDLWLNQYGVREPAKPELEKIVVRDTQDSILDSVAQTPSTIQISDQ